MKNKRIKYPVCCTLIIIIEQKVLAAFNLKQSSLKSLPEFITNYTPTASSGSVNKLI